MAVADHRKATDEMLRMRDVLLAADEPPPGDVKMAITCAGIAVQRRLAVDALMAAEAEQFRTTLALLFVLVLLCNGDPPRPSGAGCSDDGMDCDTNGEDSETDREEAIAIAAWESSSFASELASADGSAADGWTAALRTPGSLCQSCLTTAARRSHELNMAELANMGALFFRTSARAMASALFDQVGRPSSDGEAFLTLDTVGFMAAANNSLDERLLSIVDSAESEAGQTALRDIILSFKLPRSVVGVRRTCLLGRESNKIATEKHSQTLGGAHDAAMRGARWTFEKDDDPIHKTSALLSGLAIMLCTNAQSVRKDDMFQGRVDLPFLETTCPPAYVQRLALIEHTHEWVVYHLDGKGQPRVSLRQQGYPGLLQACVLFASKIN